MCTQLKKYIFGFAFFLFLIVPNRVQLIAPKINFDSIQNWNRTAIEQMIYAISDEEGFNNPKLLIDLARHESIFLKVPKKLDSNNKWSLGLYHWQKDSFNDYCIKKYHLQDNIMNPVVQTRCTIRAIKDGYFTKLWTNSAIKIKKGL